MVTDQGETTCRPRWPVRLRRAPRSAAVPISAPTGSAATRPAMVPAKPVTSRAWRACAHRSRRARTETTNARLTLQRPAVGPAGAMVREPVRATASALPAEQRRARWTLATEWFSTTTRRSASRPVMAWVAARAVFAARPRRRAHPAAATRVVWRRVIRRSDAPPQPEPVLISARRQPSRSVGRAADAEPPSRWAPVPVDSFTPAPRASTSRVPRSPARGRSSPAPKLAPAGRGGRALRVLA